MKIHKDLTVRKMYRPTDTYCRYIRVTVPGKGKLDICPDCGVVSVYRGKLTIYKETKDGEWKGVKNA